MANEPDDSTATASNGDPAAIFGAALSLWQECHARAQSEDHVSLSDCFAGIDGLMREVMRIGTLFEKWACRHVNFDELGEVWPYHLEDSFGAACLSVRPVQALMGFAEVDCLSVALELRLPLKLDPEWVPAVDLIANNTTTAAHFRHYRVQSVRLNRVTDEITPLLAEDDANDLDYAQAFYSLYGVDSEGLLEHIADRDSLAGIIDLVNKLFPGIELRRNFSD
jgi:hypothetical protein